MMFHSDIPKLSPKTPEISAGGLWMIFGEPLKANSIKPRILEYLDEMGKTWSYPPPKERYHQNYCIFSRRSV